MYNEPNYPIPPPPYQKKWYQRSGGIVLLLFLFFPFGLYLMWRHATWNKGAKWIVTGTFALLVLANGMSNRASTNNATHVTATTQQPAPTPTPTPTPKPQTPKDRIIAIAKAHDGIDNNYIESLKVLQTTIILGDQWNNGTMKDSVKIECFNMQKSLWTTNPPLELKLVVIGVKGSVIDQYGNVSEKQVGWCKLGYEIAKKFNWTNLTWRTAWDVYTEKGLAPFLQRA